MEMSPNCITEQLHIASFACRKLKKNYSAVRVKHLSKIMLPSITARLFLGVSVLHVKSQHIFRKGRLRPR